MKQIKTAASYAAKILCMVVLSCIAFACSEEITSARVNNGFDKIETHDYTGYSIGTITNSEGHCSVALRLDLGYKQIEVDESILGKIDLVTPTNPTIEPLAENDMVGSQMQKDFTFSPDGQTAHFYGQWLADTLAQYHYELVDVFYAGDYTAEPIGDDGSAYKMTPHFTVTYRHSTDATKNGSLELYPDYIQVKKGAPIIDSLIVTTHNYNGYADGQVKNLLATGSAEITVTLTKMKVEVEKNLLGQLTLTNATTPTSESISTTTEAGMRYNRTFTFSDTQSAIAIYQHLYQIAAENHVEITGVNYVDYTSQAIDEKTALMTPHFNVTYRRLGSETATGSFDLYPRYQQVAKEDPVETYTYKVDSVYKDKLVGEVKKRSLTLKITKYNSKGEEVKKWTYFCGGVVISGHVSGYNISVLSTEIKDHTYLDEEALEPEYHYTKPVEGNEQFVETMTTHLWRYQTHFTSDAGGDIYTDSHLLFQSISVTFRDGDFTYQTQKFQKSARVAKEEIIEDPALAGKTKTENQRTFLYSGTHQLTVENILDGEVFFSSTASSPLWLWQQ